MLTAEFLSVEILIPKVLPENSFSRCGVSTKLRTVFGGIFDIVDQTALAFHAGDAYT